MYELSQLSLIPWFSLSVEVGCDDVDQGQIFRVHVSEGVPSGFGVDKGADAELSATGTSFRSGPRSVDCDSLAMVS